ncbi:MAG: cell division protein FtsZ [Candidatus Micrarchaeota archaeon]|nr:cell division protein FtsZ [Candidatus Micrarchaeota archaeon]
MFDDIIKAAKQNSVSNLEPEQKKLDVEPIKVETMVETHTSTHGTAHTHATQDTKHDTDTPDEPDEPGDSANVRISVIGVGGAGCNCIDRLTKDGIKSAKTFAINTDGKHLKSVSAHKKILLGKVITRGLGAGGDIYLAKKCAEADRAMLKEQMGENEIVFICAGMGGGTGGGAAPVIAQIAKEQGSIVISIVTYPFALERVRLKKAQESIQNLVKYSDTVVVIDNNRLSKYFPNLPITQAFELADSITARAVTGITDTITFPSLMNVDFADVRAVMQDGGVAMISLGEASGMGMIDAVVKDTLEHPLLDVNYEGARGSLIHIEGGPGLTLGDAIKIGETLTATFDPNASIKIGARVNQSYGDKVRVTAIITGVKSPFILKSEEAEEIREQESIQFL